MPPTDPDIAALVERLKRRMQIRRHSESFFHDIALGKPSARGGINDRPR